MNIIKLNAIDSTNDYLKMLSRNQYLENYTTVVADSQTKGKGQMGSKWLSEDGKNLIMSVLIKDLLNSTNEIFDLNIAVSLAVIEVLDGLNIPKTSIKWPNDIMSGSTKIAGILIENSFKSDNSIASIVGIGLNVNQIDFDNLPNASSLSRIMNFEFDVNNIFASIIKQIIQNCNLILNNQSSILWVNYHEKLFKKGIPMAFKDNNNHKFMGIITEVSRDGLLQVMLEDDSIKSFEVKQIQMLY